MKHPLDKFRFCPSCGSKHFDVNNSTSKKCGKCGFIYYFNPKAATVAVIVNEDDEILVTVRANEPAKGTLDLPGGFCESYETAEESVMREVNEETGVEVDSTEYMFSLPNIYPYSGLDVHTMDLFFKCSVTGYDMTAMDDVAELKWIPLKELDAEQFGLDSIKRGVVKIMDVL